MNKKKTQSSEELYGELGQAFNFTQGDLEANRAGFMSHRQKELQKQRLRKNLLSDLWITLFFAVPIFLIATMLYRTRICSPNCESVLGANQIIPPLFVVLVLCLPPFLLAVIWTLITYLRDKKLVHIQKLTDKLADKLETNADWASFVYEGQRFRMSRDQFSALWSKPSAYTIYYLPISKQILALEEVFAEQEAV